MIVPIEEIAKSPIVFLCDLSWVSYKSHHAYTYFDPISKTKKPTLTVEFAGATFSSGHVYGVLNTIKNIKTRFPDSSIVLCMDGLNYKEKIKETHPESEYKQNRGGGISEEIHRDSVETLSMASAFPQVYYSYHQDYEADTLMASIAWELEKFKNIKRVLIYTADKDLLQTTSNKISLIKQWESHPNQLGLMGQSYAQAFFGVDVKQIPLFRAITGDASDNLKGIQRFPKKLLKDVFNESKVEDPKQLWELITLNPKLKSNKSIKNLIREFETVRVNYSLMKIVPKPFQIERMERKDLQDQLFEKWRMGSIECFLKKFLRERKLEEKTNLI